MRNCRFVAVLVACLVVAIALLLPRGQVVSADPKAPPEPPASRYQLFKMQNIANDCLLDTATGRVWQLEVTEVGRGKWVLAVEAPK